MSSSNIETFHIISAECLQYHMDLKVKSIPDLGLLGAIGARVGNLMIGALGVFTHGVDYAIAGLTGTIGIVTGGCSPHVNRVVKQYFVNSSLILPDAFGSIVRIINPRAEDLRKDATIRTISSLIDRLFAKGLNNAISPNVLERHVLARVQFLGAGLLYIVSRVVDTIFGVFHGISAMFSGGLNHAKNRTAYTYLNITELPYDIYKCAMRVFVPRMDDESAKWWGLRPLGYRLSRS